MAGTTDAADAAVIERAFVRVTGPDAETFLQGQLSQDLGLGTGLSFLLDPAGKVVAFLRFSPVDDGFLLDTDPEAGDAVVARLQRFLLRTKAEVARVDDVELVRVFGAAPSLPALGVPAWAPGHDVHDVLGPVGAVAPVIASQAAALLDGEVERRRILAGVPRSGVDIGPDTIPAEAGRWTIEAGVSFTKGCYTGQELVARIDSRGGNVPRPLRVLQLDGPVVVGAEVHDADGEVIGAVTSASADVALAPIARRVEPGSAITAGGVAGSVVR